MKKLILSFILVSLISCTSLFGQKTDQLTGNYTQALFVDVINDLESKYGLRFFYDPSLDSTQIDLSFQQISLKELLKKITDRSNINFYVKDQSTIIATGEYVVKPALDDAFFNPISQTPPPINDDRSVLQNIREIVAIDREKRLETELIEIGKPANRFDGQYAIIEGYVKDIENGEPIVGASVFKKDPLIGINTDQFGYYTLKLPKGNHEIIVNSTGMKATKRQILLNSDGKLNFELRNDIISLKEVVVTGESNSIDNLQTGFATLNMKDIKQIPSIMGEADIMKIALTLPGVQTVGEGAAGFNVRGGSADQNLVLLNDVPVYNTNHLFGFFSVFNPDVIASANLYKSGIGANYGGRIASVFDVALRDGNKKKFSFKGGISPVTGKIMFEGPIKKDTSSFIVGIRSTYSDWIFSLLDDPGLRNSTGSFSDIVGKVTHKLNDKNDLILSGYHSRDRFKLNSDSLYRYFNSNLSLQWRHSFNNQLNAVFSTAFANYNYELSSNANPATGFDLRYDIKHYSFKTEFNYFLKESTILKFGLSTILYVLQPGNEQPFSAASLLVPTTLPSEKGLESAIFAGYETDINSRLSAYAGFRLSMFNSLGPGQVFTYQNNAPREKLFITDTTFFSNNEVIKTYVGPEIRLSTRYKIKEDLSLKFSYDRMNQYIHVLSNTTAISPTDNWRLSSNAIKPQIGDQFSIGLYKTVFGTSLALSLEGYYKKVKNVLEYKDGANLLINDALETDIISAEGKSYGVEFLLKKNSGKFSGWLSYTYSRSLIKADGDFAGERINSGSFYPSNFDKPHAFVMISNYKINRRVNISLNLNFSSGRPATFPIVKYEIKDQPVLLYTDRNQSRIPNYFRADLAFNFEGNHRVHKKIHGSWSLSIYNLTGRDNAYSVFFRSENDQIKGYKLTIFKNPIPTITYHFKLK